SLSWRRVDRQPALEEADALAHAHQTETALLTVASIESDPRIADVEMEIVLVAREPHRRFSRVTVPHHVVQRFLRNPVQTARPVRVDRLRQQLVRKVDLDVVLL